MQLLWEEYRGREPEGYSYSQLLPAVSGLGGTLAVSLRQEHRAGEKLFVDYAGDTIPITDSLTGDLSPGQLFVAVLGCSNYTYAEVTPTQQLPDWISAQVNALSPSMACPRLSFPTTPKPP